MTTLLASSTATAASATEGNVKTFLDNLRTVLAELLGTDSANKGAALAALQALFNGTLAKTADYTVVSADRGKAVVASGSGGWTLTLQAAATLGDGFVFGVVNNSSGVITIDPNLSETVNGATTYAIHPTETVIVYCDGAKFLLFGKAPPSVVATFNGLNGDIVLADIQSHTAGTKYFLLSSQETMTNTTNAELLNCKIMQDGVYRVRFTIAAAGSGGVGNARIYKNGSAVGTQRSSSSNTTYTEDVTCVVGDTIQIFGYQNVSGVPLRDVGLGVANDPIMAPFLRMSIGAR